MKTVRQGTEGDRADIMRMAQAFWGQTDYAEPFEAEYAGQVLTSMLEQGLVVVFEDDGQVVGVAAAASIPLVGAGSVRMAVELIFYVDPGARGSCSCAVDLVRGLEDAARSAGLKYLCMVSLQSVNPDIPESLYRRLGYTHAESAWRKEL